VILGLKPPVLDAGLVQEDNHSLVPVPVLLHQLPRPLSRLVAISLMLARFKNIAMATFWSSCIDFLDPLHDGGVGGE
jgi:hypothetical protein